MLLIVRKKAATPIFPHLLPQGQQMATLALDQGGSFPDTAGGGGARRPNIAVKVCVQIRMSKKEA